MKINFLKNIIKNIKFFLYDVPYKKRINTLSKEIKKRKIRVLFYNDTPAKWGYQSLYDLMAESEFFEPIIVVGVIITVHQGLDNTRSSIEDNYNFFKSRGMNVEYGYKNKEYIDFKEFKPDIVFYEQPWGLPEFNKPRYVMKYALTCYAPYTINSINYSGSYFYFHE